MGVFVLFCIAKSGVCKLNVSFSILLHLGKRELDFMLSYTPRATSYPELGGSWNSEVNKENHARQGSV